MGQFSWITSDTNERIYNDYGKSTVYLLVPEKYQNEFGEYFAESNYEGYGVFGGRDAYALVAMWNRPEDCKDENGDWKSDDECRGLGIEIACYDEQNASLEYPIKITSRPMPYSEAKPSINDTHQGWHEDCDDEEYWDDEDYWDEW